jgi:hypothetical protein
VKDSIGSSREQPFRQLDSQPTRIIDGASYEIADDFLAVYARHQPLQHDLRTREGRMRGNRHLTAALQPMEEGPLGHDHGARGRMLEPAQQISNERIVSSAFDPQSALADGRQTDFR